MDHGNGILAPFKLTHEHIFFKRKKKEIEILVTLGLLQKHPCNRADFFLRGFCNGKEGEDNKHSRRGKSKNKMIKVFRVWGKERERDGGVEEFKSQ